MQAHEAGGCLAACCCLAPQEFDHVIIPALHTQHSACRPSTHLDLDQDHAE